MNAEEREVDAATAVAATERVTLGLREFPVAACTESDDVEAHLRVAADLRDRVAVAFETVLPNG